VGVILVSVPYSATALHWRFAYKGIRTRELDGLVVVVEYEILEYGEALVVLQEVQLGLGGLGSCHVLIRFIVSLFDSDVKIRTFNMTKGGDDDSPRYFSEQRTHSGRTRLR
jgi:hypothetical protein